jgi:ABC-type multidrug transport system ATPase subunit
MQISLNNTGKRYNRDWIFRHFSYDFLQGNTYAITGPNGSGKSTLLQVIAGAVIHSEGKISYSIPGKQKEIEEPYLHVAFAAPYLDLVEEMTAKEMLSFHHTFKPFVEPAKDILGRVGLAKAADKQIRYFSSGMKQRLKLAQAFYTRSPVLLLDEPLTNLDADGIALYRELVDQYTREKMVIVSSNDPQEYAFCDHMINVSNYK